MTYDPIEQARLIYEAQPTAYNASAYQVAMQLAALKVEIEQNLKSAKEDRKAAKAELAFYQRMANQYRWHPIETAPKDGTRILVAGPMILDKEELTFGTYIEVAYWERDCWCIKACRPQYGGNPKYWMDLPEAPVEPVEDAQ